ncbi:2-amino-4-hydroxy-6-hydroxymethyldihydropteridine pyrophosphokinase [Marinobacterium zhoushanense]|uniref:2-amino-4-hydroxy-6-hydroxymethyldihydropteridine pyrophosphokinase n=1 Tax=Marinobacterium zhoushanense TaxID=1679163 RepID=A0ABQ1KHR4_9GAMM|nr:2-amino-4-hydroxy-6-hydroxymethyldihydropteridine diphosphokinase [Marinobacterium zhoushanense]GGC00134.1 2-amino-4-hydroxy-6-hydroxymethyldihydropteridine pyrophosphokinase [Marinobacterium zhoushanense]
MTETVRCFIGLGSNLDDPQQQVLSAFDELAKLDGCRLGTRSSLYRSDPVGPQDQPDFINAVAELYTSLEAEALLDQLQAIEQHHRRVRERHWGPRTLDLDLLLYGNDLIDTARLHVPHPYMRERGFVLWPLAEIAPELTLPGGGALDSLLALCPMGTLERLPL